MPVKYFGLKTSFYGRPLWEIVMNLKDFGVGRIVVKNQWEKYPEPSFYRILSVDPHVLSHQNSATGELWTELTYRGKKIEEAQNIGQIAWQPDFRLLAKHELQEFLDRPGHEVAPVKILPKTAKFPPLWSEILKREKKSLGKDYKIPSEIELLYDVNNPFFIDRPAKDSEKPEYNHEDFRPISSELYKHVIWDKTEASQVYKNTGNKFNVENVGVGKNPFEKLKH